jgi:hypothetical protein
MVLAIANRQNLVDQPHMQQEEEEPQPLPCGSQNKDDQSLFCVSEVGHLGRHKYPSVNGMVN